MPRLYLRLILAAIVVALLTISTGAALAAPPQQADPIITDTFDHVLPKEPSGSALLETMRLEEGQTGVINLSLIDVPNGIVTVGLQNQGLYDVTVSPPSLTFYNNTWDTAQTVTVTAVDDSRVEDREDHQIRLNLSGTGDEFDSGYFGSVVIRIIDNDELGLHLLHETDEGGFSDADTVQITEGDTLTKIITLASEPDSGETVTVTYAPSTDAPFTISTTSMTFTSSNWQNTQNLVITSTEDDDDSADDSGSIAITVTSSLDKNATEWDIGLYKTLYVNVIDDEEFGFKFILPNGEYFPTIPEGETGTFSFALTTQPTSPVTVTVTDNSEEFVAAGRITFLTSNWSTAQTVTITTETDKDGADEFGEITLTAASSDTGYALYTATLPVIIKDTLAIIVTGAQTVNEGTTSTYTVTLNAEPLAPTTISFSTSNHPDVTLDETSWEATSANWDDGIDVIATFADDDDGVDDEVRISFTGADYLPAYLDVTVRDNDNQRVAFSIGTNEVDINEDSSSTYRIRLATSPTSHVTIDKTIANNSDQVRVTGFPLHFDALNWGTDQTITVEAIDDDIDDGDLRLTIKHHLTTSSDYSGLTLQSVFIKTIDDDMVGVTYSESSLQIRESGGSPYTVKLRSEPTSDVTIAILVSGGGVATVNPTSLTFTSANWALEQTVVVRATNDDIDGYLIGATREETLTLSVSNNISSSDSTYGNMGTKTVSLTLTDDDTKGLNVSSSTSFTMNEGTTRDIPVVLRSEPTANVIVAITTNAGADLTLSHSSFTFTATNWNSARTVTITAVDDNFDDEGTVTVTFNPDGGDYDTVASTTLRVSISDNDQRGVTVSRTNVPADEGATKTYTIVLKSAPTSPTTVTPESSDETNGATVSPDSWIFSTSNWNSPKMFTITVVDDNFDESSERVQISHSFDGGDYGNIAADAIGAVTVFVSDDDTRGVKISQTTTLEIDEDDTGAYTIKLRSAPFGGDPVNISLQSNRPLVAEVSPANVLFGLTADSTNSVFKWDDPQTITVTAVNNDVNHVDHLHQDNLWATIEHAITPGADSDYSMATGLVIDNVIMRSKDNDTRGVTTADSVTTMVTEGGNPIALSFWLLSEPIGGNVTITASTESDDISISPKSRSFNTQNWRVDKSFGIEAVDDDFDEGDDELELETATITFTITGGDYESQGVRLRNQTVEIKDNDTRGITVSKTEFTILEGAVETYTFRLHSRPTQPLTINFSDPSPADLEILPNSIEFDADWATQKPVVIRTLEDFIDEGLEETYRIQHSFEGGGDYSRGAVSVAPVPVTITDNDTRGVTISPTTLTVAENESENFTVVLKSDPTSDVTVSFSHDLTMGTHDTNVTFDPASITFTSGDSGNWDDLRTIAVNAAGDADSVGETGTITVDVTGGDYFGFNADDISLTLVDADEGSVLVSPQTLTIPEGDSATFDVKLNTDPLSSTTVMLSVTNWTGDTANDVSLSAAMLQTITLTFTGGAGGNWNDEQTVTVMSAGDDDAVNESATIMVSVSANYVTVGIDPIVAVTVTDPDVPGVFLPLTSASATEGGSTASYTVVLTTQPVGGDAVVTIENLNTQDFTADPTMLIFTAGNWGMEQTVTVTAFNDDFDEDETETFELTHSVSGGDYLPATEIDPVEVVISDDDTRGVTVSESERRFDEEETLASLTSYTVVLLSAPISGPVIITVASDNDSKVTVSPSTPLEFTVANWNNPQRVTLTSSHDPDTDDETATITHEVTGADYESNNVTASDVLVFVTDNDMEGVTVSPTKLRFVEGQIATYTVQLQTQPSVGQTVTVYITEESPLVRVDPDTLEFTRDNWAEAQTVTVQSRTDADEQNDIVNIMHRVENYGPVTEAAKLEATVAEFDIEELRELADLGKPTELTATASNGVITLRWQPPEPNDDGRVPTSYQYRYTPTDIEDYTSRYASGTTPRWITVRRGGTARSMQFSGLINLAEYTFQVRGVDAIFLAESNSDDDLSTMVETTGTYKHRTRDC